MRTIGRTLAAALLPLAAVVIAACAGAKSGARIHPEELRSAPRCSGCHEADLARYDHLPGFERGHGAAARQSQALCELCHRPSSCADCHGVKEEIKPADKRRMRPGADTPHRGDYLTQHRIDGRLNPAACYGCHGRTNEWRCKECHR